jgi:FkbM family methyltransferase
LAKPWGSKAIDRRRWFTWFPKRCATINTATHFVDFRDTVVAFSNVLLSTLFALSPLRHDISWQYCGGVQPVRQSRQLSMLRELWLGWDIVWAERRTRFDSEPGLSELIRSLIERPALFRAARQALGLPRLCRLIERFSDLTVRNVSGFHIAHRRGTADDQVLGHSFDNDIFLSWVPEYRPRPGDTVMDVGAHIGDFSLLAASFVRPGLVYAIEPGQENAQLLLLNKLLNDADNVCVEPLALERIDGLVTLYHFEDEWDTWAHTTTKSLGFRQEQVRAETLRHFFARRHIARVDFAKFNCEGAEFPILIGSSGGVLRTIERMLVLYHADLVDGACLEELIRHVRASGFRVRVRDLREDRGWLFAERI